MRVAVVGAGIAGLSTAARLATDHDVVVLERNDTIGGRLGTIAIGGATFDAGAQFFTVRGDDLRARTDDWLERGVAFEWCRGFGAADGYPRYAGAGGMSTLAIDLADGLDVRTRHMVFSLERLEDGWSVMLDDASRLEVDAVVITCPVAQAWALLAQSDVELPDELARSEFRRIIAALLTLDAPSTVPDPGGVQLDPADPHAVFGFVADNQRKGISDVPAVTLHASWAWSSDQWDDSDADVTEQLVAGASEWVDPASIVATTIRRWRFAAPAAPWPDPCWVDDEHRVVVAGDLFAGPKIEGAFDSGLAAAAAVAGFVEP
ncbi:MAG: FAD-dependent oxidoreductase [Ilumatobacter fluminis]|uniref:NAD(P)/FAD-dependent oxidoreductase n=1 Tax=Ilumatobacter fluminis TaxID=467091 RepID=UPI0032EF737A